MVVGKKIFRADNSVGKFSRGCQSVGKISRGCINLGEKFPGVVKKSKHKFPKGQFNLYILRVLENFQ